jgi:hypothetical protein
MAGCVPAASRTGETFGWAGLATQACGRENCRWKSGIQAKAGWKVEIGGAGTDRTKAGFLSGTQELKKKTSILAADGTDKTDGERIRVHPRERIWGFNLEPMNSGMDRVPAFQSLPAYGGALGDQGSR